LFKKGLLIGRVMMAFLIRLGWIATNDTLLVFPANSHGIAIVLVGVFGE